MFRLTSASNQRNLVFDIEKRAELQIGVVG